MEQTIYGITAVRYSGSHMVAAMMGLIDSAHKRWELWPAPARVVEVIDRMVEGDRVISMFPDDEGGFAAGPEIKVGLLPEGTETLTLDEEEPGRGLQDLPRF